MTESLHPSRADLAPSEHAVDEPISDAALVIAARDGSKQAFAQLYDRYAGLVRAVAYDRCGDRSAAAELAQEAFLRAYRGLGSLRDPTRVLPWLIQITRNTAMESIRREQRHRDMFENTSVRDTPGPIGPADPLEQDEMLAAVAALPEPDRTAIRLFYLCEQPADQARAVLGLSRSGFYKTLDRARHTLRRQLDPAPGAQA